MVGCWRMALEEDGVGMLMVDGTTFVSDAGVNVCKVVDAGEDVGDSAVAGCTL